MKNLMQIVIIMTVSLLFKYSFSQTNVSGIISSNTFWSLSNSPYIVTGNVLVDSGFVLTIDSGVEVKFMSNKILQIDGTLKAIGTQNNNIVFTSNSVTPNNGDWSYIYFTSSSVDATYDVNGDYLNGSTLQYVQILFGGSTKGVVYIDHSAPFLSNCKITKSAQDGIYIAEGGGKFIDNQIFNNSQLGIYINNYPSGLLVDVKNSLISNNQDGGIDAYFYSANTQKGSFNSNIIDGNSGVGIEIKSSSDLGLEINDNIISCNGSTGVLIGSGGCAGGEVLRNIIVNNASRGASITPGWCGFVTNFKNNVVAGNVASIGGAIYDSNSSSDPVYIENNLFQNNYSSNGEAISISGANTFKSNTIAENPSQINVSIKVNGLTLISNNNFLSSDTYSLYNLNSSGGLNLNAKNNWWNTTIDNNIQTKIFDWFDDGTKGFVDYQPYLNNFDTLAPISAPKNIQKSVSGNDLNISWSPNNEPDVAGYKIYYGNLNCYSFTDSVDVGNLTNYTVTGLSISDLIAVTAYDNSADGTNDFVDGNESWFSYDTSANLCDPPIGLFTSNDSLLTVNFTDVSSGSTGWLWNFGDGVTSILQNPIHTYNQEGTYNICLIVSNSCGSDTVCSVVVVSGTFIKNFINYYDISIIPNPNSGKFSISLNEPNKKNFKGIISMHYYDGRIFFKEYFETRVGKYFKEFDLTDKGRGVFFILINDAEGLVLSQKVIITD